MYKPTIKICGIRSVVSAQAALVAGADFIGLNFISASRRSISIEKACEIADSVRGKIAMVGIFANHSIEEVNDISTRVGLDYVQLHGNESMEYIKDIKTPVIRAFSLSADFDVESVLTEMKTFEVAYFLVDRDKQGEGNMLSREKVQLLAKNVSFFLAGGLTPENVGEIVRDVHPFAVDVAGGIETEGVEDIGKITAFIANARVNT